MSNKELVKKSNNCVDAYADSFGYSSFGDGSQRLGSISFFHNVTEWPVDESGDVENIKTNLSEARSDISRLRDISADTSRDVAVVLQKIVDVDEKLSKKPSKSEVQTLISSAVNKQILWTIGTGFALLGIAKYIF
ncbi:hypothetical protein SND98_22765 [Escherichia coli]|nr:hypothetical protein [Escherichia coli]